MSQQLYRMFNAQGELLYIGISTSALARFAQHKADKPWSAEVVRMDIESHDCDRSHIAELEAQAIRAEKPKYNVKHNNGCELMLSAQADAHNSDAVESPRRSVFDHVHLARHKCPGQYFALQASLAEFVEATCLDVDYSDAIQSLEAIVGQMAYALSIPDEHDCPRDESFAHYMYGPGTSTYPLRRRADGKGTHYCHRCGKTWSSWW